ncbi:MAG: YbaN family protein [Neisseria sp.]|nr:YbaN family protein [Neisseria sp.]
MKKIPAALLKPLLGILGAISLALGIAGIYLPGLPTTPFILLAAACWAQASPAFHRRLREHRLFGKIIRDWETRRAVPRRAKYLAYATMTLSCIILWWRFPHPWWLPALVSVICLCNAVWMARLPDA